MDTLLTKKEKDELVVSTLWLVKQTAFSIFTKEIVKHPKWEDLHAEGIVGLVHAANKATHERLPTFPRFASFHIRKKLVTFWHKENLFLKLPRTKGELAGLIHRVGRDTQGHYYPADKIFQLLPEHNPDTIKQVLKVLLTGGYDINDQFIEDHYRDYIATQSAEDQYVEKETHLNLYEQLKTLPDDERDVLLVRYGFHTGQPESPIRTGKLLKMTQQQVLNLEKKALETLQQTETFDTENEGGSKC